MGDKYPLACHDHGYDLWGVKKASMGRASILYKPVSQARPKAGEEGSYMGTEVHELNLAHVDGTAYFLKTH